MPGHLAQAERCHRKAIALLGSLPVREDEGYRADLAAAWVNLGCALQAGSGDHASRQACDAFGQAIALLERLPFESNPRFRHNLAAAWMNRARALERIGADPGRGDALAAHARAVAIARLLPMGEKPSYRILLASCLINQGSLQRALSDLPAALGSFQEALSSLGCLPRTGHRLARHLAATALTDHAQVMLESAGLEGARQAVRGASMALEQLRGPGLGGAANAGDGVRALWVMAQGLERMVGSSEAGLLDRVSQLTDALEQGMELAMACRGALPRAGDAFFVQFFDMGCRAYGRYQPQFLPEFVEEALERCRTERTPQIEARVRLIARRSTSAALGRLGTGRLLVAGSRQTERLLEAVHSLRGAAEYLR